MNRVTLLLTLAAVICLAPLAAIADDVTVKVIEPDKAKPAGQPNTPSEPKVTAPAGGQGAQIELGDRRLNQAFGGLNMTAEQAAKVQEAAGDLAKQMQANNDDARKKFEELRSQDGAREKIQQAFADARTKNDELRKQLLEKVNPLLTEDQQAKLKERLAQSDRRPGDNGGRGGFGGSPQENTERMIGGLAERAGITLTGDQKKKLTEKLTTLTQQQMTAGREMFQKMGELREKARTDPAAQKELDDLRSKVGEQFRTSMKAYNDAVVAELTPEQKVKFDEAQQKMRQDRNRRTVEGLVSRAGRAGADDTQKAKIADLAKAAQEAMDKLPADDENARNELRQQLEKDILTTLNDEQKKKFSEEGNRFGRFNRGGDRNRDRNGDGQNNNDGGRRNRDRNRDRNNQGQSRPAPGGDSPRTPPI